MLDQAAGGGGAQDATTTPRGSVGSRLVTYGTTVFILITVNFFLPRAAPGDPVTALLTSGTPSFVQSEELRAELEEYYGLDRPLWEQYADYLGKLVQGDLGVSIRYNVPVADLVVDRLPWTLLLIFSAMALAVVVGWISGINSGWRRGRPVDTSLLSVFLALRSFPVFFLGSLALFVFAVTFDLVPLAGARSLSAADMGPLERAADVGYHLLLPAVVLASQFAGGHYLLMRAGMVGELGTDHLRGGRAKGLRERRLKYRYAARNALLPVVTVTALQLSLAVTGSILVETVFTYPGMGKLVFDSIEFRDYPVLQACFLILSLFVVTANFLADLLYRRLDPRTVR